MAPQDSFTDIMNRLRAGEDAAAFAVFERFARQLHALARRHLDSTLRLKVDPDDLVQSAYKSFFLRYEAGKLEVSDWNNLWGLLTLITLRKCADRAEYYRAERRDPAREVAQPTADEATAAWCQAIDREPTPVEATLLAETIELVLAGLDADERKIVELSLQGYKTREISEQINQPERTVRRLRERVRLRLERMQREGP
jgi:RNA polymerase sigma-70 factor (ECF subfamily)